MSSQPQRVYQSQGAGLFWQTIWARAYPRIIGTIREPSWLFFETLLPLMATISYVYVYKALDAPPEYIGFVVVGGAMTAFWLNVLWAMGSQLYWDKEGGNLELYVVSPAPMMAVLLGMAIGGIFMTSVRAITVVVLTSLLFGISYETSGIPLVIVIFVLTLIALYGLGMMFASIFLAAGREAWHMANLLQEPVYLFSGFYFPIKALGAAVATAASVLPMTLGMDAMRQLLFDSDETLGFLSPSVEAGLLVVLSVIFLAGARYLLNRLETVGRREGRLIERRR